MAFQLEGTADKLSIDDIHLVCWHKLFFTVMALAPILQIFWSIESTDTNIYMLCIERTHVQDLCFPIWQTVKYWILGYIVTN
jgi:hypothetical protein